MTQEDENRFHKFETRLRQLILAYKDLKQENERLADALHHQEQLTEDKDVEIEVLQKQYADLRNARILEVSSEDVTETRRKISQLIREIDKTIALLNI
jgi:cell shape-determining protein MreC